ncbi:NnrS family protein [Marinospirillum alkaliphilum]|uniref:Uncharacterized protein involved in response to NO n=1 Tax=Marinospirillum alkaliphilum DSM 21637 TaxID=1122209 RepID=A0A1K1ZMD1_9GAMM|nr:NnrS family protein [Marinospirillum alkaliphilum]SFX75410.1 uncharacterized protein involved in response to NO [Marinospirillum alkaliphilum DSM 21637]
MTTPELNQEQALHPLLRQAFRPLFLLGALFSLLAMLLWGLLLTGRVMFEPYGGLMFWHQHEMLFGFVAAIIVGFLLTAVQNWTGVRATHGRLLLWLTVIWLAGRVLMFWNPGVPGWLAAGVDLVFLPVAALLFGLILVQAGKWRNLFFVPLLLLLTVCNLLMHLGVLWQQPVLQQQGALTAVWLITLVMAIVSGRVLPMFTANGTGTPKVADHPWLDRWFLGALWLIVFLHLTGLQIHVPDTWLALLYGLAALLGFWRVLRVKIWVTWRVPLLWSLHLACWFIPLGLALFAAAAAGLPVPRSTALHALAVGAMGLMILAMMARISLGHTGRLLQAKPVMSLAFLLILLVAGARVLAPWLPGSLVFWYQLAAAGWVLAYACYCLVYWPVLTRPRADGRPG